MSQSTIVVMITISEGTKKSAIAGLCGAQHAWNLRLFRVIRKLLWECYNSKIRTSQTLFCLIGMIGFQDKIFQHSPNARSPVDSISCMLSDHERTCDWFSVLSCEEGI